jgi:molybdopterin-guanine dinucleotide biosynthesis protein A
MGRDKALVCVDGRALALRVADALRAAGAEPVLAVGGDLEALAALGLAGVPDEEPGAGPLTGILTALAQGNAPVTFVAACDLVAPSAEAVTATVAALGGAGGAVALAAARGGVALGAAEVAVPLVDGRRQWMHAAWRAGAAAPLAAAFAAGERAVHAAVAAAGLRVADLSLPPAAVADADTPADLA